MSKKQKQNAEAEKKKRTPLTKEAKLNILKKSAMVLLGCIIYSFGVAAFLDPTGMAAGGVTGISILISNATGGVIGTAWLILIINVPLFIIGYFCIGKMFALTSLLVVGLSSALMELWGLVVPYMQSVSSIIAALVGGALFGGGLGLVFRTGSSTGGTDVLTKLLRKKFRYIKTGIFSVMIDFIIVMAAFIVYRDLELMLNTIISLVVFSAMFNRVLYGGNSAMIVQVVTTPDRAQPICDGLLKDLDVGATVIDGKGAYSGADKVIVMCVIKNYVYPRLRDVIKKYDDRAFIIVSSALEIYGEGYKDQNAAEL
ncbi:MAG: YitT family protein [Clostridiales bacterium]|nr:YitT family protein [Clostridiales bacterium]